MGTKFQIQYSLGTSVGLWSFFIIADDGRVLKIVYNEDEEAEKANAVVVEELEVFGNAKRVVNMYRYREEGKPAKIVVIGDEEIKALPVHRCHLLKACR